MSVTYRHPVATTLSQREGEPLIRVEGIGRRYRIGDREVVALADVSVDVRAEEFVVVLRDTSSRRKAREQFQSLATHS